MKNKTFILSSTWDEILNMVGWAGWGIGCFVAITYSDWEIIILGILISLIGLYILPTNQKTIKIEMPEADYTCRNNRIFKE